MTIPNRLLRPLLAGCLGAAAVACQNRDGARNSALQGVSVEQDPDRAAIRRLFEAAAACGDRYRCPPQDQLLARAESPGGTPVAEVAFELMIDPGVRSFDRLGTAAYDVALSWAGARVKAGTFDRGAQERFLHAVRRVLASDSSTFVEPAYTLFAGPIGDALPESREILTAEATNPRRDLQQMDAAAKVLQRFLPDLSLVQSWLESGDERREMAAISLLDYMDHRRVPKDREIALLSATARQPKVPSSVAMALIAHAQGHEDEAFLPVIEPLIRHPDPEVQERAKAAVATAGRAAG